MRGLIVRARLGTRRFAGPLSAIVAFLASSAFAYGEVGWDVVRWQIARKFPKVPTITTTELAEALKTPGAAKPVLLDVRTAAEFAISHLAGARHVEPGSDLASLKLPKRKDTPVVTYCSVGYRSADFAQRLREAGFSNVRNLEGSIFQWANEGRPVVCEGQPAAIVHPYNKIWGSLLKPELRANTTPVK